MKDNNKNNNKERPVDRLFDELVEDLTRNLSNKPVINLVTISMSQAQAEHIFSEFKSYLAFVAGIGAVLTTNLKRNIVVTVGFRADIREDDMETINIACGTTNVIPEKYNNKAVNTFMGEVKKAKSDKAIKDLIDQINNKEMLASRKKEANAFKRKLNKVENVNDLLKQFGDPNKGGNA